MLNIIKTIYLNSIFYTTFSFFLQKQKEDFIWFFIIFHTLYRRLDLKNRKIIITNRDIVLIAIIKEVLLYTTN